MMKKAEFAYLLDALDIGVVHFNSEGNLLYLNTVAADLLYAAEIIPSTDPLELSSISISPLFEQIDDWETFYSNG